MSTSALADRVLEGDTRSIARAISLIEDQSPEAAALIQRIHHKTGQAWVIGVTGPPGAGKSTLVNRLIGEIRKAAQTVGVIVVDPTSPFTGGAVLGDRVRMGGHSQDSGVFIRSMATRGHLGGLARATSDAALVLDAAGTNVIVIETVGVGQDEVEIVRMADISVVTLVPGTGDDVQALKAGIMEIADIFVVNKADREGADHLVLAITSSLSLADVEEGAWRPPVLKTSAIEGVGVPELWATMQVFRARSASARAARRVAGQEHRLRDLLAQRCLEQVDRAVPAADFQRIVADVTERRTDPYSAVGEIMARLELTCRVSEAGRSARDGVEGGAPVGDGVEEGGPAPDGVERGGPVRRSLGEGG